MRKMIVAALGVILLAASVLAETTYRYEDDVRNPAGVVVSSATVTVYVADTTTEATLYSGIDTALGTRANPVYTDSAGRYWFYALPGRYDIKVERSGYATYTREDVIVGSSGAAVGSDWPSIEDYGAGADDTTDDTSAIAEAIQAVYDAGGGNLLIPAGDFYVNKTGESSSTSQYGVVLLDGVTLIGEPGARIVIPAQQGGTAAPLPVCYGVYATEATNIGVRDIEIVFESGQPTGATHEIVGIKLENCSNAQIDNVTITAAPYAGIMIDSQDESTAYSWINVTNCKITGSGGYTRGIYAQDVSGGIEVSNNEISSLGNSGIYLLRCLAARVHGNEIRSPGRDGIELSDAQRPNVSGNIVTGFGRYGISVFPSDTGRPSSVTITGNTIYGSTTTGDAGVYLNNVKSAAVSGNSISTVNWDGSNPGANIGGIYCYQTGTDALEDITIAGNTIEDVDPDYAGGLIRRPFAIAVRGVGGPIRGITIGDNTIENSYGGVYSRPTGARTSGAWTIRNVTTAVDTTGLADSTAPTASDSTMAAVEEGTTGNVTISWSLTASEQSRATARWRINSGTWYTESPTAFALQHSDVIYTSEDAVQDDTVKVNVMLTDLVGNPSTWIDLGQAVIDTIPADPSDTTPPTITAGGVNYQVSGGVIQLTATAFTYEDDGAILQTRYRVNGDSWVEQAWTTTYTNLHAAVITTNRAPTDGDEFDVYMRAEDQSENMSAWAAIDSVVVSLIDDEPPTIETGTVSAYSSGGYVNIYYTFTTYEGAVATLRYSRNGGAWTSVGPSEYVYVTSHSGTITTAIAAVDGDVYALEAIVEDETGNASASWVALGSSTVSVSDSGDPAISYVSSNSGTFSNGVTINIIGDNFGTIPAGSEAIFEDWQDLNVGAPAESDPQWVVRSSNDGVDARQPFISSDLQRYSGDKYLVIENCNNGCEEYGWDHVITADPMDLTVGPIVMSFWMNRTVYGPDANQYKFFQFSQTPSDAADRPGLEFVENPDAYPDCPTCSRSAYWRHLPLTASGVRPDWQAMSDCSALSFGGTVNNFVGGIPQSRWFRVELVGYVEEVCNPSARVSWVDLNWYDPSTGVTNLESLSMFDMYQDTGGIDAYHHANLIGYAIRDPGTAGTVYQVNFGDFYMSNTFCRVELGDNSDRSLCTLVESIPYTAWSNGAITATLNVGQFSAGETAYLFVYDSDNNESAASAITIGGSSGTVTPSANFAFSLDEGTGGEAIIVADTRPGGASINSDISGQWRYKSSAVWSPVSADAWYSGLYVPEPYLYKYTGIFADATPDTIVVRAKLKSSAGVESGWYTSGDLVIYEAPDVSVPTIVEHTMVPYSAAGDAAIQGLITPSIAAAACVQHKVNFGGSWTPSDTTLTQSWTSVGDAQDPIDGSYNSSYTTSPGDTVYFRVTLRSQAGVHTGSWYTLDSYIEPGATSVTRLYAFADSTGATYLGSLNPADFDSVYWGDSVEGVVNARWPTDADGSPYAEDTWYTDLIYGGALPWAPGEDGSFYIWYPGHVAKAINGKTITDAKIYLRPYSTSNDLTGAGEGAVVVAINDAAFDDWNIRALTSWGFSWAYQDTTGAGTAWTTQTWSNDVTSYSAIGDTATVAVNFVSSTAASIDVTSLMQAVADMVDPSVFKAFAISIINADGSNTLRVNTGDGGTIDRHPVLTITTED